MSKEVVLTQEEIERGERQLQAEIKKCGLAIEKAKQELEELKIPKGFFSSPNKKAIKAAEEQLQKLEVKLIDLQAMTGSDYCKHQKEIETSNKIGNIFNTAGNAIENAVSVVPGVGKLIGKAVGKGFTSIGDSIKKS